MGERAEKNRFSLVQGIRRGRPKAFSFVITPASGSNLLDIYPASEIVRPCHRNREFYVLGIGADYDDALMLAGRMVAEVYGATGGFDLRSYMGIGDFGGADGR